MNTVDEIDVPLVGLTRERPRVEQWLERDRERWTSCEQRGTDKRVLTGDEQWHRRHG